MKILKTGLLAATALFSIAIAKAQTVDEIISKHITAIGGKEKISQITSLYMEGSMEIMGNEVPMTTYLLNGKGFKTEMEFNGQKIVNAMNEKGGWMINPMMGSTDPQSLPEEQFNAGKYQMLVGDPLVTLQASEAKVELLGTEKVADADAYKLKLTAKDSSNGYTFFVDTKTYYLVKMIAVIEMMGQEAEIETSFSDYKKTDFGYVVPFKTEISLPQGFTMTSVTKKIEVNKAMDPAIFEMPSN